MLTGTDIPIPDAFTGTDLDELSATSAVTGDPRLAQAAEHAEQGQVSQYLAGGPALLERYRTALPAACALIDAAMDARRLGHGLRLPESLLEAAVRGYLTDSQWDGRGQDWLEQALAYTAKDCRGARGPLTIIQPSPGDPPPAGRYYRLADYLEQHGRTRRLRPMPKALLDALIADAAAEDLARFGGQAEEQGLNQAAIRLYGAAAERGNTSVLLRLAWLLRSADRVEEALTCCRRAIKAGDTSVEETMADLLVQVGRAEEAIPLFQRVVERGRNGYPIDAYCAP